MISKDTMVIVISDHGFQKRSSITRGIMILDIDKMLEKLGLLKFKDTSSEIDFLNTEVYSVDSEVHDSIDFLSLNFGERGPSQLTEGEIINLVSNIHFASDGKKLFRRVINRKEAEFNKEYDGASSELEFSFLMEEDEEIGDRAGKDEYIHIKDGKYPLDDFIEIKDVSGAHDFKDAVIIISGGNVKKGQKITKASIFDITPTILYLFGLPIGKDMNGKVLTQVIEPSFLKSNPLRYVETYEQEGKPERSLSETDGITPVEEELREILKSLGYTQ